MSQTSTWLVKPPVFQTPKILVLDRDDERYVIFYELVNIDEARGCALCGARRGLYNHWAVRSFERTFETWDSGITKSFALMRHFRDLVANEEEPIAQLCSNFLGWGL